MPDENTRDLLRGTGTMRRIVGAQPRSRWPMLPVQTACICVCVCARRLREMTHTRCGRNTTTAGSGGRSGNTAGLPLGTRYVCVVRFGESFDRTRRPPCVIRIFEEKKKIEKKYGHTAECRETTATPGTDVPETVETRRKRVTDEENNTASPVEHVTKVAPKAIPLTGGGGLPRRERHPLVVGKEWRTKTSMYDEHTILKKRRGKRTRPPERTRLKRVAGNVEIFKFGNIRNSK